MTPREDEPLSPLDAEIELLLGRLTALLSRPATPDEAPIREVAVKAIRDRLKDLSMKCTDRTCRIRIVRDVRKAMGEDTAHS